MISITRSTARTVALFIASTLLLMACASGPPKPTVDYKSDYNFMPIKKIAFYQDSGQVTGDNPLQLSDMQRERIDTALAYALGNRGFQIVDDAAQADMFVTWHLVTQNKTDVQTWNTPGAGAGYYGRYNRYSGYNCWNCGGTTDVTVKNYTEGTFIVDMIDPALSKSVWRGVMQSRLKSTNTADQEKYNAAATAIFASFPP
jgi:hypothetical protein